MQNPFIFILVLIGLVHVARLLTVVLHELGHAITASLLIKGDLSIYIGSYGDPNKSIRVKIGRFIMFFRYNLFAWRLGLFVPSQNSASINRQIIITLAGPLASLTIGSIAAYFTFNDDLHGFLKLFLILFLGSAILDFWGNLVPSDRPIKLYDGRIIYNDGHQLKQLFYFKRLPIEYSQGMKLYNNQQYADAAILFEKAYSNTKDANIFRLAISSYLHAGHFAKGKELSDHFILTGQMNADDFSNMAVSYSQLTFYNESLHFYDKSLALNPDHKYSLNNKGYALNLLGRFEEAIPHFDRAIKVDNNFAYPYNNRGLARIKLGQSEEGLQDIYKSMELDPDNAYCYRHLGIYHFDKGEFEEALRLFEKAKKLDASTHMIDQLIDETKWKMDQKFTC